MHARLHASAPDCPLRKFGIIRGKGHTPLDVKSGDKILFGKWSGTEVKIDGQDLLIMKESDILGVVA